MSSRGRKVEGVGVMKDKELNLHASVTTTETTSLVTVTEAIEEQGTEDGGEKNNGKSDHPPLPTTEQP